MRVLLVRHCASVHSERGIIAVRKGCLGLTDTGRQQAAELASRWQASTELGSVTHLFSSPTPRAFETATALVPALPVEQVEPLEALMELDPGVGDGMTWEAFRREYPSFEMQDEPDRPFSPQGESLNQYIERVRATMHDLAAKYAGQTIVAVTHGGFISMSLVALFAIPRPGTGAWVNPRNASVTEWHYSDNRWLLDSYNR